MTEPEMKTALDGTFIKFVEYLDDAEQFPFREIQVPHDFMPNYNLPPGSNIARVPMTAAPGKGGMSGVARAFTPEEIQYIKENLDAGISRGVLQKHLKMGGSVFTRALAAAGYPRLPCTRKGYPGHKGTSNAES
jgi:hypothetical protein